MRLLAALLFLAATPTSAQLDDKGRDIVCYSGGRPILTMCGIDVILGPNQVTFTACDTLRRVWVHADCVVEWGPGPDRRVSPGEVNRR